MKSNETVLGKFTNSKIQRDKQNVYKDKIISDELNNINIKSKKKFHALLMSSLYGPEAYSLIEMGIPSENIFTLEGNPQIHKEIVECKRLDRKILSGIRTTNEAMPVINGLERAHAFCEQFNLIYLDYLGQPNVDEHYETFIKIFELRMIASGGKFIVTCGKTRTHSTDIVRVNNKLLAQGAQDDIHHVPTKTYIRAAIKETEHQLQKSIIDHHYVSVGAHTRRWDGIGSRELNKKSQYVTTVVQF